jgi:hypothetical protein
MRAPALFRGTGLCRGFKVIKRVAHGFRDDEYFFLRIRHAFPGNLRRIKKGLTTDRKSQIKWRIPDSNR